MPAKDKNGQSYGKGRTRNYATVVYPESAPEGWQNTLAEQCIPAFISPLHDKDVNPTGEAKKPHYHVMIMFENVKTREQAMEIFDLIGGVGCEVVNSIRGYARYLCHMDNPDKVQYNTEDVHALAGADYADIIGLAIDKYKALGEMLDYCDEYGVNNIGDLIMYCRQERFDWFRVLCDSGIYILKEYMKSRRIDY